MAKDEKDIVGIKYTGPWCGQTVKVGPGPTPIGMVALTEPSETMGHWAYRVAGPSENGLFHGSSCLTTPTVDVSDVE